MQKIITVIASLVFTWAPHAADLKPGSAGTQPATPTQATPPASKAGEIKQNPKPEDFVGKWTGKWDDTYGVQFTITTNPDDKQRLTVVYEWEEQLGQPFHRKTIKSKIVGNVLNVDFIEITISAEDASRAIAKGNFARPRTAILTKAKQIKTQ